MTTGPAELPRYLQLLWGIDDGVRRGPKPKLTVTDIGRAAVEVADADGLDAVSMKAIAQRLGVTTMSLYRYVEAKEDVFEIMLDVAYGRPGPRVAAGGDWRERIASWAGAVAEVQRARPWMARVPMTRPPAGPCTLLWTEAGVSAFADTPLTGQEKLSSLLVVDGFVRNHVRMAADLGELGASGPGRQQQAGRSSQYEVVLGQVIDETDYPCLTRAVHDQAPGDDDFYADELAFGLGVILDGIAARVAAAG